MKRRTFIAASLLGLLLNGAGSARAVNIPVSLDLSKIEFKGGLIALAAQPLPTQAFFGKNVVIPVTIQSNGPIVNLQQIQVSIVYQLTDSAGATQGNWQSVPVTLQKDLKDNTKAIGTAIIVRNDFLSAKASGHLRYYFRAHKGGQDVFLTPSLAGAAAGTAPVDSYDVAFIDNAQFNVPSEGGIFHINDTYQVDGKTAVAFEPGALSGPGTLQIHQEDPNTIPTGPRGLKAVTAFTFTMQPMTLARSAKITLSYPANIDGTVSEDRLSWKDLALYRYISPTGWELVSRPEIDPVMHTVTGYTTHFSLYALFPTGPVGAAEIRPMQKIITPNGDGINDTISFTALTSVEEVRLFDIRGRRVRTVTGPPHIWDGKDDQGQVVESGVYIYQYTSQGDRVSGVIVVAK